MANAQLLQTIEVAQQHFPFEGNAGGQRQIVETLLQQQCQERAEHVAADRGVAGVEDRPCAHHCVCRNETEAANDRAVREAIVAALDAQLKRGDKALIGNAGYRRYLRKTAMAKGQPAFEIGGKAESA